MCYYNRPNLVKFALNSLKNQDYLDWEAVFVDDNSDVSMEDYIRSLFPTQKIHYVNTHMTDEAKKENGGSIFGLYWNIAASSCIADYGLMLCDDDAMTPGYLSKVNDFFNNNPDSKWGYSHYLAYNPFEQDNFRQLVNLRQSPCYNLPMNPDSKLDASQVVFHLEPFKKGEVGFPYPCTANLDSALYRQLYPIFGDCPHMGCFGQFKGMGNNRLEVRQHDNQSIYSHQIDINFDPFGGNILE